MKSGLAVSIVSRVVHANRRGNTWCCYSTLHLRRTHQWARPGRAYDRYSKKLQYRFFLKPENIAIQLKCEQSSAKHNVDIIAKHLPTAQLKMTNVTKPIVSRIKCMMLEVKFHKCVDAEIKRQALLEQKAIMDNTELLWWDAVVIE